MQKPMIAFNVNNKEEFDAAVDCLRRMGYEWQNYYVEWESFIRQVGIEAGVIRYSRFGTWGSAAKPAPTKQYYIRKFKEAYETICRG